MIYKLALGPQLQEEKYCFNQALHGQHIKECAHKEQPIYIAS